MVTKLTVVINLILIVLFWINAGVTASPNEPSEDTFVFLPIITTPPGPIPFGPTHTGDGT